MAPPRSPRLFYGYVVVAACFVVLFFVWGMVLNTFPIFLKPITEDMHWGRGALAVALLMGSVGTAISAPIAGILIDRIELDTLISSSTPSIRRGRGRH